MDRPLSYPRTPCRRRAASIRTAMLAALWLLCGLNPPAAIAAGLDAIAIRFHDDLPAAHATALPAATQRAVESALGVPVEPTGRTRDGAFTLRVAGTLDADAARAALNRVRRLPGILYANAAPGAPVPATSGRATDRIIVKYRDTTLTALARAGHALDTKSVRSLAATAGTPMVWLHGGHDGSNVMQLFQRPPLEQAEAIAARIAQDPAVEYAHPDYIRTAQIVPTDPCYASAGQGACNGGYQWDLFDPVGGINMPAAWSITTGSAAIYVAVIDTGALLNHPDLAGRFIGGYDMIADCAIGNDGQPVPCVWTSQSPAMTSRDSDASDPGDWVTSAENAGSSTAPPYYWLQGCGAHNSSFHGTHVAGTIGAVPNNGIGVAGINWVSRIVPVRVLGKCGGYTSDIAAGIVWAAGGSVSGLPANPYPARVLSLSLGGSGSCDATSQSAINTALGLGAVVVVAAGNSNADAANYSPSSCSGVITVAATIKNGTRARYSNYGATVEIAAPGGNSDGVDPDILSTLNDGTTSPNPSGYIYARYAGTSMATPHVSGVASLMLSVNPALTPAQVLATLQSTARTFPVSGTACNATPQASSCDCTTALCGAGILNAGAAVAAAVAAGGGDTTPPSVSSGLAAVVISSSQINLSWSAATDNVGVAGYRVYRGGVLVASPTGTTYSDSGLAAGTTYSYTVAACDAAANCSAPSSAVSATTLAATPSTNVALASAGAVASASSSLSATAHPVSSVINNERTGGNYANALSWVDGTPRTYPDWVQVNFSGARPIDRVVLYTMQDNYTAPVEPTDTMTFTKYGVTGFTVQTWNGSAWVTQATITGNNLIKRTVTFARVTTDRIRINVTSSPDGYSYITEIEAWSPTTPDSTAPSVPTGLAATPAGTSQINLAWSAATDNVGVTGYKVYRGGTLIGSPGGISYSDTGLAAGTTYSYTVAACDAAANCSAQSTAVSATTVAPDTTPPSVPSGLAAAPVGSAQVNLTWNAATDNVGVAGYKVYRGGTLVASPVATSYSDTGLSAATTYSYTVAACDAAANCSAQSTAASATTAAAAPSVNVALASAGGVATASSTFSTAHPVSSVINNERTGGNYSNALSWVDGTPKTYPDWVQINFSGVKPIDRVVLYTMQDNYTAPVEPTDTMTFTRFGVTGFTVQTWNGSAWVTQATVTANNLVKRTVTFAQVATDRIRVNVTSSPDGYSYITEIEAWSPIIADSTAPSVPTGLAAAPAGTSQINLTWNAATDNVAVTGYQVYRGGTLIASPTATSYSDSGRAAATTYSYTVAACDAAANCSAQSAAASATTPAAPAGSNVALASAGAVASASSSLNATAHPVSSVINNERTGGNYSNALSWVDGTGKTYPDWVQINFAGARTISTVVLYTMQDNYTAPVEPTDTMTFTKYGVTGFTVQTWNGSAWITQATVTANNLVKRTVAFSPVTTDRIRVNVTSSPDGYSYITEIEAWGY